MEFFELALIYLSSDYSKNTTDPCDLNEKLSPTKTMPALQEVEPP